MKRFLKPGFTIIETMLFLGISGMLIISVMVGTGASINIQRYRDSVTSLQSVLQEQYSQVLNVNNGRDSDWECDGATGVITKVDSGSGVNRGQTDCVVLGRFVTPSSDGKSLIVKDVIGSEPIDISSAENDIVALKSLNIRVSPVNNSNYSVQWNAQMVKPLSDTSSSFSILILNSPLSGITRTFISPTEIVDESEISNLISGDYLDESVTICINSNGFFTGTRMAVFIRENASNASGVESLGENSGC